MATIPVYDVPQAAPSELPGAQFSAGPAMQMADLVGRQNQALGQAGLSAAAHIQRVVAEHQATVNEADQKTRLANLSASLQELVYAPDTGYTKQEGGNAVKGFASTRERITQIADAFGQDITDPNMQQQYKLLAQHQVQMATQAVMEHASRQTKTYELNASQQRAKVEGDGAVLSFNPMPEADNSQFTKRMRNVTAELADQGMRHLGYADGSQELAGFIAQGVGQVKADLVNHLVAADQITAAERVFKSMRDQGELSPKDADQLSRLIDSGKTKSDGLSLALKLGDEGKTLTEQEKALNGLYREGKLGEGAKAFDVYEIALHHLRASETQRKEQQTQADNASLGRMFKAKLDNPNMTIGQVPAVVMARATQDIHYAKALESLFSTAANPDAMSPDAQLAYYNVMTHMGDGSAADISLQPDAQRLKLYGVLGQKIYMTHVLPQIKHYENQQDRPSNDPSVLPLKIVTPAISRLFAESSDEKLQPKDTSAEAQARRAEATRTIHDSLLYAQQQAGKVFSEQEVNAHIDKLAATDVDVRKSFMGVGWASQAKMLGTTFSDVPPAAVTGITKVLRERGLTNPTEAQILLEYRKINDRFLQSSRGAKPAGQAANPFQP